MEPEVITKQKITSVFNDEDVLPPIVDYINDTASLYELALEYVNRNREVFG
jgi:hypothetical protein